jgi:branched-chain amino acid transport system permease protein
LLQLLLIALLVLRPTGQGNDLTQQQADSDAVASTSTGRPQLAQWILWLLLLLGLLYPILDGLLGLHWQATVTSMGIFILLALGLNLLLGFAGLLNLGYAASFGIGGYVAALLTDRWGNIGATLPQPLDFMLVVALSALIAAIVGALTGALTLRLRSDKLAIVTLAVSQVIHFVVSNLDWLTGGNVGLAALPPPVLLGQALQTPLARYYLVLGVVLVGVILCQRLRASRMGRAWLAIGSDEVAAASCGVAPAYYKTQVFAVGTALAGVAGALYVSCFSYIDPDVIDFRISAMILAMVILGGAGNLIGVIGGAIAIAGYDRLLIPWLGDRLAQLQQVNGVNNAAVFDVRGLSYLTFGLALYLTVLVRVRRARNHV